MTHVEELFTLPTLPEELLASLRRRTAARSAAIKSRAVYISQRFPQVRATTIANADLAMKGMLTLPGTGAKPFFVGNPPDWFANPFKDEEYVWQLSRMYQWEPLLAAYTFTGEPRYALKVTAELRDWLFRCPPPAIPPDEREARKVFSGVHPWRSLEAGIRMYESWPWILEHLGHSELLTASLVWDMAASIHAHGVVLEKVCPLLWPRADHNHYLMENLGLLSVGRMFPEFADAPRWIDHAMKELWRCAQAQVTEDGGHIEGCPGYHNGCVYWFCLAVMLANGVGRTFPPAYEQRVRRMLAYSIQTVRPTGTAVPWGDSGADSGAAYAGLYAWMAFADPTSLKTLRRLMGEEVFHKTGRNFVWRADDLEALPALLEDSQADVQMPPLVHWDHGLNQVAMRTSWNRDAMSLFFACRSPVFNGHAHADPMGFDFCALGRPLLVDPGIFTYRNDADRRNFKSAEWHNTVTVNRRPPFEPVNSWNFTPQKQGNITAVFQQDGLLAAEAVQMNFEPVIHRRLVALIDSRLLLVIDAFTDLTPDASVQMYYHLDSTEVTWDAARRQAIAHTAGPSVLVGVSSGVDGSILEAKISEHTDVSHPSRRLCLNSPSGERRRVFATIVVPFAQSETSPRLDGVSIRQEGEAHLCEYELDGNQQRFFWEAGHFTRH